LRIYVLSYKLTSGGPMPFTGEIYFIFSRQKGKKKQKKRK